MRISLILLLLAILLTGCKNEVKPLDEVTLTLLNDSLTYVGLDERTWYNTEKEKDSSLNVVRYRLTNNSDKKLLFLLRDPELMNNESLSFIIEEDGKYKQGLNVLSDPALDDCGICILEDERHKNEVENKKLSKLGVTGLYGFNKKYESQKVVIAPGESWEFKALISLPVADTGYRFSLYPNLNYNLSLVYQIRKSEFDYLPEHEKENMKRNNIEVFSGKLTSNKVNLTCKNLW